MQRYNVISIWGAKLAALLYPLLITPLILQGFGILGAGIFVLVNQIAAYINLFDFGITNGIARYIRRYEAGKENGPAPAIYVATCFAGLILTTIAILGVLLIIFLGYKIFGFWHISAVSTLDALLIASALTALSLPFRLGGAYFIGYNIHYLGKNIESVFILAKVASIYVIVTYFQTSIISVIAIIFTIVLSMTITLFMLAKSRDQDFRVSKANVKPQYSKRILSMSLFSGTISFSSLAVYQLPLLVLATQEGINELIFLAYPVMIMLATSQFCSAFQTTLTPKATQFDLNQNWVRLRNMLKESLRGFYVTSLIILANFYLFGEILLRIWLPQIIIDQKIHQIYMSINALIIIYSLCGVGYLMTAIIIGAGSLKKFAYFEFIITIIAISVYVSVDFISTVHPSDYVFLIIIVMIIKNFIAMPIFLKLNYSIGFFDYLKCSMVIPHARKIQNIRS